VYPAKTADVIERPSGGVHMVTDVVGLRKHTLDEIQCGRPICRRSVPICLSDTHRCSTEKAKRMIMQGTPHYSPRDLVF